MNDQSGSRKLDPWQTDFPQPEFDPREVLPRFEKPKAARKERRFRQSILREGQRTAHHRLAAKLDRCSGDDRCLSPACPLCVGRFRIWYIGEMLRCLDDVEDLIFVTIINDEHAVPPNGLKECDPRRMSNGLRQQMKRVGFGNVPIMGGIDGDYRERTEQWRPHFHFVAPASAEPAFRELRKRFYCSSDQTHKPLVIKRVGNRAKQVSYCFKGYWRSKISYTVGNQMRERARRLPAYRHREWLLWRDRFDISDFMFLYGARRSNKALKLQPSVIDKNESKP